MSERPLDDPEDRRVFARAACFMAALARLARTAPAYREWLLHTVELLHDPVSSLRS